MLIFIPVYFSTALLLCGLFVFIFRGLYRNSTHSPCSATSHSYTTMQVQLCSHAELHFTELESLNYEKKIEAPKRQIALKFTPAAKLLQKNRTFPGKTSKVASTFTDNWLILIWYYIITCSDLTDISNHSTIPEVPAGRTFSKCLASSVGRVLINSQAL